ncbi:nucleotide disphospho-sugar-binding domain-containing protein [Catenuloplanes atrovinosus]|uniref:UDP:flavonoid glycosyltransferase YjiC (YdhE family) n=1 Tax=Catenuloplanes atrovinosus TaxID=137266 RepID=A0AAE4CAB8_9ACTN|nr:nucleotide disphospho-sugar-binding domain-containing protein [Catenuloplanes atrovinosus]MDR7276762.1 UDP:flavonoid glycosyltransferase YjiC (YdhE family) [Catenuloplanes atrovinosus]
MRSNDRPGSHVCTDMRVLYSAPPQAGHLLPGLPTISALRAAGHEVLLAGYGADPAGYAVTGLPVVDVGGDLTVDQAYRSLPSGNRFEHPTDLSPAGILRRPAAANAILSRNLIGPLLGVIRDWRPDVLLYDPFQGAVPLASAITGVPAVEHGFGLISGPMLTALIAEELAETYREHGAAGPAPAPVIEVVPPSLREPGPDAWQVRYVPLHGASALPRDLLAPADRPRVLLTFGTIVGTGERDRRLGELLPLLAGTDADFLLPAAQDTGPLPGNVRALPWAPVTEVLRHCRAIIHHGGAGTLMAAVTTGTPQLIIPHHGDQFHNAEVVTRAGIGLTTAGTGDLTPALLDRLLHDASLVAAVERVRAENARQPAPSTLVARFESLR